MADPVHECRTCLYLVCHFDQKDRWHCHRFPPQGDYYPEVDLKRCCGEYEEKKDVTSS
jgi:hypothetical protein